jgi:signal transduction histidine kinase
MVYHLTHAHIGLFLVNLFQFAIFLTGYLTITRSGFKFIRSTLIFLSSLLTIYSAVKNNNGIEFILLPVLLGALIIYDSVWLFVIHTFTSFAAIIFIRVKQANATSFGEFFTGQNLNFVVSLSLLLFIVIAFKQFYLVQHQKLEEANKQLQLRSEELEKTNVELERFVFVASHDLQEPLRLVANFVQLFEKKYKDIVDDTGKKYIRFAVDGVSRMRNLLKDLLQYSQAGADSLEIEKIDINEIVQEVLLPYGDELNQPGLSIKKIDLPVIKAGRTAMIQLMQNLLSNAIKFKGKRETEIVIKGEETSSDWTISVADNGIGIDHQYFEKIFIVFQRLHSHEEYEGTGIGLSICKKIVDRYHGRIWVESESGMGSCFKFSIPKNQLQAAG